MAATTTAPAYAGVDTHKDTNTLGLIDSLGRVIGTWEFPTGEAGYARLERAIGDASVPVGIEGTGSYGAGLAAHLRGCGYDVYEVVRPKRGQRRRGKSDPQDAIAAAQNVAAGRGLAPKELSGAAAEIGWLMRVREGDVRWMTATSNRIDSALVTAPEEVRSLYAGLSGEGRIRAIAASRPGDACRRALRMMARDWLEAKGRADELEAEIARLVRQSFPALAGALGVGPIVAARLIAAAGSNPGRVRGEAAFSMLCGTSPIPASSGRTSGRHRLNRGGDRQANRAIHEIARARMAHDPRTQAYIARKVSEGKSKREAVRCLCRYIAREVYHLLTGPQEAPCDQGALRERRRAAGATQAQVAEAAGLTRSKVGRLERMVEFDTESLRRYDECLRRLEGRAEEGLDNT